MSSGVMVGYNMQNKYLLLPLVHFINAVMIPYAILSVITEWYIGETTFISKRNTCSKKIYKKSKRLLKMTSLKIFFSIVFKVTVYMTPKIRNVLMWDRPMQIWAQMTLRITMLIMKITNSVLVYTSFWCQNSSTMHMKNPFVSEPNNSSQAFLQLNISKWILNQELVTLNPRYYLIKKWECS
jgi:hypothetical protein